MRRLEDFTDRAASNRLPASGIKDASIVPVDNRPAIENASSVSVADTQGRLLLRYRRCRMDPRC